MTMPEVRPRPASSAPAPARAALALVLAAAAIITVAAVRLLGASTAWLTPTSIAISLTLMALTAASLVAVGRDVRGLRIAIAASLLGAKVGFIAAELAGYRVVRFVAYPSTKFAVVLAIGIGAATISLVRHRMWARWAYLGLGLAAIGSGGLNAINFWPVSGHVEAHAPAWSMLVLEQSWGYACAIVAGLLIVANLAPIGDSFVAGRSHATWTSDAAVIRALRRLTIASLVAIPMLLVYAWVQPLVPATVPTALALAAVLTLGVVVAVRGGVIGALFLCLGGVGLAAQTITTCTLATGVSQRSTFYYAAFWMPAAILALVAAAHLAGPVARLLRR